MPETFDPYHSWLGIPSEEQPPNQYRLLGITLFESKPDVIENAADQRMAHLKSFQAGNHSALSQKLLNEVAAARICLLNARKKAAYDAQLRAELESQAERSEGSLDSGLKEALQRAEPRKVATPTAAGLKPPPNLRVFIGVGVGAVIVLVTLIAWLTRSGTKPEVAAHSEPKPAQQPVAPQEDQPAAPLSVKKTEPTPAPAQPPVQEKVREPSKVPAGQFPIKSPEERAATQPVAAPPTAPTPTPKPAETKPAIAPSPGAPPVATSPPQPPLPVKPESPPTPAAPKQKLPLPEGTAVEQARKAAAALFKAEIEKARTAADKVAMAKRLLSQALDQTGDAAGQYVQMLMAQDLAVAARDAETAFQCVDQIDGAFVVDRFAMKTAVLVAWAKDARTPDARKWVVEQILVVGDEALDAGNLDAAKELGQLVTSKSSGLRDKDLVQKLKAYRQRFTEVGKDMGELKEAQAALAQDPKNPQANLVVGRYLCFSKGDWKKGLPLLVLGSDPTLKRLANQELTASPTQPNEQVPLADGWWEIASTHRRSQMNSIKIHAGQWYRQASPALPPGLVRSNVERRLAELGKLRSQLPAPPPTVAPFDEKHAKQHQQRWADYLGEPVEMTNSIGMKLVLIPPGEFEMGSTPEEITWATQEATQQNDDYALRRIPSEAPKHRVRISRSFYLGMYLVTQAEYEQMMGSNPSRFASKQLDDARFISSLSAKQQEARKADGAKVSGKDTSRHPVETVSWDDAAKFCRTLSALPKERSARRVYRLPTEAEWEYACRAGTTTRWYCGDDEAGLVDVAWFQKNAGGVTHPVGQKKPNAWGLYDMHGSLWQWCLDWYDTDFYRKSPPMDPSGPIKGSDHVNRGGCWGYPAGYCRSAFRGLGPGARILGLRVLLVPAE